MNNEKDKIRQELDSLSDVEKENLKAIFNFNFERKKVKSINRTPDGFKEWWLVEGSLDYDEMIIAEKAWSAGKRSNHE